VEGQESNGLPTSLESTTLCELVYCRDGGATFLQFTFPAVLFVPHPTQDSELPDNKLD
jgi:hypothetical protein